MHGYEGKGGERPTLEVVNTEFARITNSNYQNSYPFSRTMVSNLKAIARSKLYNHDTESGRVDQGKITYLWIRKHRPDLLEIAKRSMRAQCRILRCGCGDWISDSLIREVLQRDRSRAASTSANSQINPSFTPTTIPTSAPSSTHPGEVHDGPEVHVASEAPRPTASNNASTPSSLQAHQRSATRLPPKSGISRARSASRGNSNRPRGANRGKNRRRNGSRRVSEKE